LAREADLVVGVGTRWSDFTTASHTAFQDPGVRFINVNVAAFDAGKQSGLPVVADARVAVEELRAALAGWRVDPEWERRATAEAQQWGEEVARVQSLDGDHAGPPTQAQIIKEINDAAGETGVMVCAAGSAPGDLHKLWRARDPDGKGYHVEYGYSCMGYEIPGGIGVKLAAPEREVYVLVGDGSYLMLPGELVTAVAQRVPLVIVLVDNHGYASIGALSRSIGSEGFGTLYRFSDNGSVPLDPASTEVLPLDLATNAESLGARVVRAKTIEDLREALVGARGEDGPVVIHIEVDRYRGVPSYESWWDVPVAEVSEEETVRAAREGYERAHAAQRQYLRSTHE
jgi:3D-(3,5/4)-trihydroxycyclohexane-1,2-dione acylhydrolase (decyclizing)